MSIGDFLQEIGSGLGKAGRVAGAVLGPVAKSVAEEESGELPELQKEKRQKQSTMEAAGIDAKAKELESQLEMGRKYGTLTQEQQQQYVKSITDLYSHPSQMGTLVQKLHKAVHPGGATYQHPSTPLKDATPEGGTFYTEEAAREKAAKELASARSPSKEYASPDNTRRGWFQPGEEPEGWSATAGAPKSSTGKSPITPGNQLPQGAIGPDGQVIPDAVRNSKQEFQEWNGAWYPAQNPSDKAPTTKVALIHGKSYIMGWNPETHQFDRNMGEAPPNYAQVAIPLADARARATAKYAVNEVTGDEGTTVNTTRLDVVNRANSGKPYAGKELSTPTGQEKTRQDFATSGKMQVQTLRDIINRNRGLFGPGGGRYQDLATWIGSSSPDAQRFRTAALILADHSAGVFGGRAVQTVDELKNTITSMHLNPEALLAGLDQDEKTFDGISGASGRLPTPGAMPQTGAKPIGHILDPMGILLK